ncbi:MAG TPA: hypothetical protein VKQ27_12435 [Acetobacteraceae bacterium]|nr:hypothetical protein [Acetobacteraceae bacterium]
MPLGEAIELIKKLHANNRTNPVDREAAVKEMGYASLSGRSAKVLSDLSHFGLLEKSGTGSVRVARRAVEILYPESGESQQQALHEAAGTPSLFAELNEHFDDGLPSENALRSYLMRKSFASAAIPPVIKSYLETYRSLEQQNVSGGHRQSDENPGESKGSKIDAHPTGGGADHTRQKTPADGGQPKREVTLMDGERVIFVEEVGAGQYLKLVATGQLDDSLLEALEDFTKRQRKRLGAPSKPKDPPSEEANGTTAAEDAGGKVH